MHDRPSRRLEAHRDRGLSKLQSFQEVGQ